MKIKEIKDNNIIFSIDYEKLSKIRKLINIYMESLPPHAYGSYSVFNEKQIKQFLLELENECEKFNIKI